ncbi:Unknown protein sequence [Pseudomonas cannabina pv. alisalensis]|nr:Unknown protein sequence [Pseudomonas cannabina pv. alisalensis]
MPPPWRYRYPARRSFCRFARLPWSCLLSILRDGGFFRRRRCLFAPTDRKAVGVTQVDARDVRDLFFKRLVVNRDEAAHFFDKVVASQQQFDTRASTTSACCQEPAATLAQLQAYDGEAQRAQHLTQYLVLLHHLLLGPLRAEQLGKMFIVGQFTRRESLPLVIQQRLVAPPRNRQLLFKANHHLIRPDPTHFGVRDPWHLLKLGAHGGQIDLEKTRRHIRRDALLHCLLTDVTQIALHVDAGDRTIGIRQQTLSALIRGEAQNHQQHRPEQALQETEVGLRQARRQRLLGHHPTGTTRHRLVTAGGWWLRTCRRAVHDLPSHRNAVGQNRQHQLLKIQTRSTCRHRHQAVIGHARYGVHFQQPEFALRILHHIRARPARNADGVASTCSELFEFLFLCIAQPAWNPVLSIGGQVLGVVIIKTVRSAQADGRQYLATQRRNSELRPLNPLFDQHLRIVGTGGFPGGDQFVDAVHLGHTDT